MTARLWAWRIWLLVSAAILVLSAARCSVPLASSQPGISPTPAVTSTPVVSPTTAAMGNFAMSPETAGPRLGVIVYVRAGDLWLKDVPGGQERRLTTGGGFSEPQWLASGELLLYRHGGQVWLAKGNGDSPRPLEEGADIQDIAVSGHNLTYVNASGDLVHMVPDGLHVGSFRKVLVPASVGGRITRVAWSLDSMFVGFEWHDKPGREPGYMGIWTVSLNDGRLKEIYAGGTAELQKPRLLGWSPDPRFILAQEENSIDLSDGSPLYAVPLGGGGWVLRLADAVLPDPAFIRFHPCENLHIGVITGRGAAIGSNKTLEWVNITEARGQPLSPQNLAVSSFDWAINCSLLAFSAMPVSGAGYQPGVLPLPRHIWVAQAGDGWQPHQLTADPAYSDEFLRWRIGDGPTNYRMIFGRVDGRERLSLWWLWSSDPEHPQLIADGIGLGPGPARGEMIYWQDLYDFRSGPPPYPPGEEPFEPAPAPTPTR